MSDAYKDYILEMMADIPAISAKKMFGGWGIFREGLMIGLLADEDLYLKIDKENKAEFIDAGSEPFTFDKGGKPVEMSYWSAPPETLEDSEAMQQWVDSAFAAAQRSKK